MNIDDFKKYDNLYRSSRVMGSARILRDYLQLDENFPIPLSISHGIDMNHTPMAMDVYSIEPIHWSCNQHVHERALKIKPSIRIPHPWLMLKANKAIKSGTGTLVIGPPPSKSNDNNLLTCLKNENILTFDILLKYRGDIEYSQKYWEVNGVSVVTAGSRDIFFYDRLYDLLSKYEFVIGCTFSSALIFAASLGKKCKVIENYTYTAYDGANYMELVNFNSSIAKLFARKLQSGHFAETADMALDLLGIDFMEKPNSLKDELITSMNGLDCPVFFNYNANTFIKNIILDVSRWTGKCGLINRRILDYIKLSTNRHVSIIKINEIDIWLNGVNSQNLQIEEIEYKKNVTEPGWGTEN